MRKESHLANEQASQQNIHKASVWLRISLVIAISLSLATAIAVVSTDAPYEDRLVDLTLRQSHLPRLNGSDLNSAAVSALLLDYDHEMAFKAQLAIEKYGDDAQNVLVRFGDDPTFQEVIKQYGENTIPVVAYFVKNDIVSMRLLSLAQQKSEDGVAAAKGFWGKLWKSELPEPPSAANKDKEKVQEPATYDPDLRGQRAIAFIANEGHQFLGQFVLDSQGQAKWLQTERTLEAAKSFFFSGVIGLEKKYKSGKPLETVDVMNAGMDVFIFTGAFKALKFLRATQQVRTVGVMKRTQLLGAPLLTKSALGRYAMKYGVKAGTAYLVFRHPSLLSGVFVTLGKGLGISPFLAKIAGWSLLLTPLLLPLLSILILALNMAGALISTVSQGIQWMRKRLPWYAAPAV